jgi:hypothetical protein
MLSANGPGLPLRGLPIASASGSTSASAAATLVDTETTTVRPIASASGSTSASEAATLADTETTTVRFTTVKKLFEQIDQISEDILIVTGM